MKQVGILIPALNPDQRLSTLIQELRDKLPATLPILIVDDGSDRDHQAIFATITQQYPNQIKILHHDQNKGKGAALKTGFTYFQQHYPTLNGIATIDADGQHTASALQSCLDNFQKNPDKLVLGVRRFTGNVPWRSRFGNRLTSQLVKLVTQQEISDTQTGLRIIPSAYIQQLIHFPGERFEFEFEMLLQARNYQIQITEEPIPTIYLAGNKSSHFRVIRDSIAIYSKFFKFALSGLLSFLIDIAFFSLFLFIFKSHSTTGIFMATIMARFLSAIANYQLNHHYVFDHAGERTLIKYSALFVIQMLVSAGLTSLINQVLVGNSVDWLTVVAKMVVDFALFVISYRIQRDFIFKDGHHATI
ncbi:bifunctional glycosyltransferase family 2/GtrA family protein [Lapidilactobacillus wuchangensis]|uniref:bifunctional glycosyltransferase family 2/GtrA family protein n=1 Tax=Lapidilactobacillus wuchangensis TaxID=2486001 RepID=UPI000F7B7ED4|nr:bifunctional glycosyltransferase family 2/GtrA family protein [Lapidilactobacillus wuchangensis]